MNITLNGDVRDICAHVTIAHLLENVRVAPEHVVVEHNGVIVDKRVYATTILAEGDIVELIAFVGGGENVR